MNELGDILSGPHVMEKIAEIKQFLNEHKRQMTIGLAISMVITAETTGIFKSQYSCRKLEVQFYTHQYFEL